MGLELLQKPIKFGAKLTNVSIRSVKRKREQESSTRLKMIKVMFECKLQKRHIKKLDATATAYFQSNGDSDNYDHLEINQSSPANLRIFDPENYAKGADPILKSEDFDSLKSIIKRFSYNDDGDEIVVMEFDFAFKTSVWKWVGEKFRDKCVVEVSVVQPSLPLDGEEDGEDSETEETESELKS